MFSTNTWLTIICAMQVNAMLFGAGAVLVLANPALAANGKIWMPVVVIASFVIAPFIAAKIAPRMRMRYWRKIGRTGDLISG